MPRRYNLRRRNNRDVTWIEDETLKTKEEVESEEEDEDYEPPSETEGRKTTRRPRMRSPRRKRNRPASPR
jgi:hypothetical protein